MPQRLRTLLAQVGSLALAGILLYLALRGVDFSAVGDALKSANYTWLLPLIGIVILSVYIRAIRWKILLDAIPEQEDEVHNVSVKTAFYSLLIGYMVNYAAPRLGEVARSTNVARQEKVRFASVFGTVVVERILDVVVLAAALLSVAFLLSDRLTTLNDLFIEPIVRQVGELPAVAILLLTVLTALGVLFIYRRILIEDSLIQRIWMRHVQPVFVSFKNGLLSLLKIRRPVLLIVTTVAMWFCYLLMAYLPLLMLGLVDDYSLSLTDAWGIMTLGALGIAVPSPGGIGSYHFITIQTLQHLYGTPAEPAATYAVLTHAAQLVLYTASGFIALMLQGLGLKSISTVVPIDGRGNVEDESTDTDSSHAPPMERTQSDS